MVQELRKDTLLCGNVSYFNEEHLNMIFGEQPVVLMARDLETRRSGHIRWFQSVLMGDHFRRQFFMYDFMTYLRAEPGSRADGTSACAGTLS